MRTKRNCKRNDDEEGGRTMKKKRKLRIVNKTKFIETTSMTILIIVTTAMFIHKIYSCGILWFFTTLR